MTALSVLRVAPFAGQSDGMEWCVLGAWLLVRDARNNNIRKERLVYVCVIGL